jgi:hypothetical protein
VHGFKFSIVGEDCEQSCVETVEEFVFDGRIAANLLESFLAKLF